MFFLVKLNLEYARRGQSNFSIVFTFVSCEKRLVESLWWDSSVLTAARTAHAATVCKVSQSDESPHPFPQIGALKFFHTPADRHQAPLSGLHSLPPVFPPRGPHLEGPSFDLIPWWSEFRDHFFEQKYWLSIIWNNKNFRIDGKPVFYKTYFNSGICTVNDLLLNLNNINSFDIIRKKNKKANFLTWTGLRYSIPSNFKTADHRLDICLPYFKCNSDILMFQKRNRKTFIH